MELTKVKINKSNWTGEEAEILVDRKSREFTLPGIEERFKLQDCRSEAEAGEEDWEIFSILMLEENGSGETVLGGCYRWRGTRFVAYDMGMDIIRESSDPFEASAQILFNIF